MPAQPDAPTADVAVDGPPITISGEDDHIVIRLAGRLDAESTSALGAAIDSALLSGCTVVVELGRSLVETSGSASQAPWARPADVKHRRPSSALGDAGRTISTDGCGCIRLGAPGSWWTIDVHAGRLLRSSTPVERRFAGPGAWIGVRELRISATTATVMTADGSLLSMARRAPAA